MTFQKTISISISTFPLLWDKNIFKTKVMNENRMNKMKMKMKMYLLRSNTNHFIILFSCFVLLHLVTYNVQAQLLIREVCSNTANYTSKSQFETNLNILLPSLLSNGTQDGFFNTSIGTGSDIVYGVVTCRSDILIEQCRTCLSTSILEITQRCPNRKQATYLYDPCFLHYSNTQFFSQIDNISLITVYSIRQVSDATANRYSQQLASLMRNLSNTAATTPSRYNFGSADYTDFNNSKNIYGLAQCTRDLSTIACFSCLEILISYIPGCCNSSTGAQIYRNTCHLRYEDTPFFTYPSSPPLPPGDGKGKSTNIVVIVVPIVFAVLLSAICSYFTLMRTRRNKKKRTPKLIYKDMEEMGSAESLQYNFREVRDATENFSDVNKLGKGGFGIVYKGLLSDGRQIAVKRLSSNSGQGVVEFKNEVLLVVKLQHRNLVKLLGFCLEGDEKLLIYEFAENKSLDHYIFDPLKRTYLDWETCYKIIEGIARGLLYLHVDSRHRIIHRDLKAANILLDAQMEPKISDFGMARLFGVDQSDGSTGRIVGTYGYMAPEYAMHGQFSVKSDVFSFGMLILEIISGQKNKSFFQSEDVDNLSSYAWRHWENGTILEFIDPTLKKYYSSSEMRRCIHVGLLCVQENIQKRPTMATVVHMLSRDSVALPLPSTPAFFVNRVQSISCSTTDSIIEVSVTEFYPR